MEENNTFETEVIETEGLLTEPESETIELIEMEEGTFMENHKESIIAAAGTGIAGLLGGFVAGTFVERRKQEKAYNHLKKQIDLFIARDNGEDTLVIDGVAHDTSKHKLTDPDALKEHIATEFLADAKMKPKEKEKWIDLFQQLVRITEIAKDQQDLATQRAAKQKIINNKDQ